MCMHAPARSAGGSSLLRFNASEVTVALAKIACHRDRRLWHDRAANASDYVTWRRPPFPRRRPRARSGIRSRIPACAGIEGGRVKPFPRKAPGPPGTGFRQLLPQADQAERGPSLSTSTSLEIDL